jgi:hypothetical protein
MATIKVSIAAEVATSIPAQLSLADSSAGAPIARVVVGALLLVGCVAGAGAGWWYAAERRRVRRCRSEQTTAPEPRGAVVDRAPSSRLPGCRDRRPATQSLPPPQPPETRRMTNQVEQLWKEAAMKCRTHAVPLLTLLARLGWQRDPRAWTVRCRDERGRRGHVRVSVNERGPQIAFDRSGAAVFDPLATGRLRAALRDAIDVHTRLSHSDALPVPRRHPGPASTPHAAESDTSTEATGRVRVTLTSAEHDDGPRGRHAGPRTPKPESPRLVGRTQADDTPLREVA